jgi:hypothetical protein
MRHVDLPQLVDVSFLDELDKEEPGTYLAQPKIDGHHLDARQSGKVWKFYNKHGHIIKKKIPAELMADWVEFTAPLDGKDARFNAEWVGPRCNSPHHIVLRDLYEWEGEWMGHTMFVDRYAALAKVYDELVSEFGSIPERIRLSECWPSGLPENATDGWEYVSLRSRFLQQLQDPTSEGLVIRRFNSLLIGSTTKATENPHWFKIKARIGGGNRISSMQKGES